MGPEPTLDSLNCMASSDYNTVHRNIASFDHSISFHYFLLGSLGNCFYHIGSFDNRTGPDCYSCSLDRLGFETSQTGGFGLLTETKFD